MFQVVLVCFLPFTIEGRNITTAGAGMEEENPSALVHSNREIEIRYRDPQVSFLAKGNPQLLQKCEMLKCHGDAH